MKARHTDHGFEIDGYEIDGNYLPTPLGVPPDGRTVEADAFVLGTARVVAVSANRAGYCFMRYPDGSNERITSKLSGLLFGANKPEGRETRRYAIVPLAEPRSEGESMQTATHEQVKAMSNEELADRLKSGPIRVESHVPSVAESPECGTEKIWLCCSTEECFHVIRQPKQPTLARLTGGNFFGKQGVGTLVASDLNAETARLIHPSHTLQPGECCEVPAREDHWMELEDLRAFRNAVALGKRTAINGECCVVIPALYIPLTAEEAEKAYDEAPAIPISPERIAEIARSVTGKPLPSVPPVGESDGPRWAKTASPMTGVTLGDFICSVGDDDYHVASMNLGNGIARVSRHMVEGFELLPGQDQSVSDRTCANWVETRPELPLARAYRQAYDTALSANKLPPHPRWEKPEGAEVFLGWWKMGEPSHDWWYGEVECRPALFRVRDNERGWGYVDCVSPDDTPYMEALSRARELRLPERASAKKRVADLQAELDAAKAALVEIGGVA